MSMELPTMSSNRVSAFPLNAKTSFKADSEKIFDFLIRDATYKTEVTTNEMETKMTYVETVNSFIVVAAFIAGVQAQVIAFTFGATTTSIQTFANGAAFVGLTLDIIGTSVALFLALSLQKSIRRSKASLLNTTTTEKLRDEVHRLISTDSPTDVDYRRAAKLMSKEMTERRRFWRIRSKSTMLPSGKSFLQHRELLLAEPSKSKFFMSALLLQYTAPQELHVLAMIPIGAMVLGMVCLLISVISFAAYTQHRNVWLACVITTAITGFYSLSSLMIVEMAGFLETTVVARTTKQDEGLLRIRELSDRLNSSSKGHEAGF